MHLGCSNHISNFGMSSSAGASDVAFVAGEVRKVIDLVLIVRALKLFSILCCLFQSYCIQAK